MNLEEIRSSVEYLDACLRDIAERGQADDRMGERTEDKTQRNETERDAGGLRHPGQGGQYLDEHGRQRARFGAFDGPPEYGVSG